MPGITTQIQQMWIYADGARDYAGKRSFSGNMNFYSLKESRSTILMPANI